MPAFLTWISSELSPSTLVQRPSNGGESADLFGSGFSFRFAARAGRAPAAARSVELPRDSVPQLERLVVTARQHLRPVGREGDATQSECPSKVRINWSVAASHSLTVLSALPDSTCVPSGEKATENKIECPSKVRISRPVAAVRN